MIKQNIISVQEKIENASKKSKKGQEVTLIAVSKTKPIEDIIEAYEAGIRDFGENKAQELSLKFEKLPKDIRWHMIGHLQRNKVKDVVGKAILIHSVDSKRLAEEISKESVKKNLITDILIEVNIALEDSKYGFADYQSLLEFLQNIAPLPNIRIKGLMTVAPYTEKPEENRCYFSKLRQLAVDIMQENIDNISMDILSMGMTGDYEVAIEEGADFVRVGTGIFGERNYNM